ncbi:BatD family protein [Methylomonas sp. SURF-2]|uniref:BatD family protein n=1 Tax=Methylomonas subterranea TaxID=2952225 RepID=A0ABT1TDB5_9GAMM|nr:BatD family protein [Methylomonas sp. SURF-2]MCQ8103438.1 BatD family protein [Methylomonas sp. SURF-2]
MHNLKIRFWLVFGWLWISSAWAAEIEVEIDRNPVRLHESLQITFSAAETPDGSPDFSPLGADFEILNQQRSSNVSWVNGKISRSEQWVVTVMPKQAGEIAIPAIAFGSDLSKPAKVTVSDEPQTDTDNGNDEIFLRVEVSPETPYVQSQVLYTLKLYRRVQITQASLNEPEIKDALVEKLGEDSVYSTRINGMDYWVTERKYAIFPQQSGLFTVAPLTLTAEVLGSQSSQRPRFNGFFNRQITETRRVVSNAVTLNVLPVPANFTDPAWLSAQSLELKESWSAANLQTKVGEPLTRTITLTAKGATVGQLPELAGTATPAGIKSYPDQPTLKEEKPSDGVTAVREEKIAYIASQPGEFILPALNISWFNTQTQTIEVASLPEVKLTALAAGGAQAINPGARPQQSEPAAEAESSSLDSPPVWRALSAILALGWLTHVLWLYRRSGCRATPVSRQPGKQAMPDHAQSLKAACGNNDPQAAKQALLAWGKLDFGADNLSMLARYCPEPLSAEILSLNRYLYTGNQIGWDGRPLLEAFIKADKKATASSSAADDVLPPLYRL